MRKLILLCLSVILASAAPVTASTVILTGNIKDSQGNGANGLLYMSLPVPAVDLDTNTAIAPIPVPFRLVNGAITGGAALYDTGAAHMQPAGLYYVARAYDNSGNLIFYGNYVVTAPSPFNLGMAVPTSVTTSNISYSGVFLISNNNTVTGANTFSGANVFTGTNTHSGTETFSGPLFSKSDNNILKTDQFAGATFDVRANACLAQLAATVASGGICDARGEVSAALGSPPQALTIAATITIGSQQILIWPSANVIVTCTITNTTPCVYVNNQATLMSFGHGVNEGYITLSATANVASVIKVGAGGSGANVSTHDLISHIEVFGAAGATASNALVDIPSVYDSTFDHLSVVSGGFGGKLLYIHDVQSLEGTGEDDFYSLLLDCSYTTGCIPLSIVQNNSGGIIDLRFFGGDMGHPGLNQNMVNINGNVTAGGIPAISNITF